MTKLIIEDKRAKGVVCGNKNYPADAVIIATGGLSYPSTGSTGDGHRFAQEAGHRMKEMRASLVPI